MGMRIVTLIVAILMVATGMLAQQTQKRPTTNEEYIVHVWKGVHDKLLTMAKDIPEDKLGWRPHKDSRSMAEELRHVIIGLEMSSAQVEGKSFDYNARVKADEGKPVTRESIVSAMEAAIATSYSLVEKTTKPVLIWWAEHQGEHYGKLVSNYRMNGLVPPESRP